MIWTARGVAMAFTGAHEGREGLRAEVQRDAARSGAHAVGGWQRAVASRAPVAEARRPGSARSTDSSPRDKSFVGTPQSTAERRRRGRSTWDRSCPRLEATFLPERREDIAGILGGTQLDASRHPCATSRPLRDVHWASMRVAHGWTTEEGKPCGVPLPAQKSRQKAHVRL